MNVRRALCCLVVLARAGAAAAVSDAPLGVGTPGTFRSLFLEMPLADARGVEGATRFDARWWLANQWSIPTRLSRGDHVVRVQQDEQADVLQLAVTLPWSRLGVEGWLGRLQTTAEVRLVEHWGGWTDRGIERWHDLIGTWNFQREFYPRNAVALRLQEDGGRTLVDLDHPQLALSDLTLRTQAWLLRGEPGASGAPAWAVAARLDLKLPTGRLASLGGSGGADAGLGLAATWAPLRWLTTHGQGALRLVSPLPLAFPLQPRGVQWSVDLSAVVRIRDRVALVVEDRLSSGLFRGGWSLPAGEKEPEATAYYGLFRRYNQVSGGLRIGQVTAFFSEDFTPGRRVRGDVGPRWFYNSNSPDFVLGLSWAGELR